MTIPPMIPLEHRPEVGSTQTVLKARAAAGHPECALMADTQTEGTGRLGRPWRSLPGNLSLSVLLRPAAPLRPGHWSLLAALALARRIPPARLKWPNDVLLGGAKLAGILLEAETDPLALVIGFGVNLAHAPAVPSRPTACLAQLGPPPEPSAFARGLLAELDALRTTYATAGFPPIRAEWLSRGPAPGDPATVSTPATRLHGRFAGLADDGALLLERGGTVQPVHSGEVE